MSRGNILAIALAILISVIPLAMYHGAEEGVFGGSDGQAEVMIGQVNPGYKPWFAPFWEPPGGEIESMLFALQAAIGSGVLFYCIGRQSGLAQGRREASSKRC